MVRPSRNVLALLLAVLAAVATVGAVLALYLRFEVGERDAFADRTAAAFDRPEVRRVVAREVVVQLIDRGSTDLVSARPVLEGVVDALVGTPPFQRVVRGAAAQSHQLLFERESNSLVFDLADVSTVVLSGVRSVSPDIAKRVPDDVDARLVDVRERAFAGDTLAAADAVRRLAVWLPVLAVLLLLGALVLAADRRRALTRYGLALGMTGIVAVVALSAGRAVLIGSIEGTDEIPQSDLQAAVGGVWDSFLGDLRSLILIVALVGFVLASSILTVADPEAVRGAAGRAGAPARAPAGGRPARGRTGGPGHSGAAAARGRAPGGGLRGRRGAGVPGQLGVAARAGKLEAGRAGASATARRGRGRRGAGHGGRGLDDGGGRAGAR